MGAEGSKNPKESSEWYEVPEGKPKVQTVRFASGFIPHLFRKGFCRANINKNLLVQKGFMAWPLSGRVRELNEDVAEWFEEPEGFTKCQTVRFGCAFMALIFRKRFCRTNINDYSIVQKGFVPPLFR